MKIDRQSADVVFRNSFGAFFYRAFEVLNPGKRLIPNWHIDSVCYATEQMVRGESGNRLVLNLPPRTLKTQIVSACLPAWILGRNPRARIICASYSEDLAHKFSRDCRAVMESKFYQRMFPRTRLNPRKSTETEFETTERGYRFATSVGSTLTGRGGDTLIVDDPIKANDANSQVALTGADEWFHHTALTRLDSAESIVIVTMQRLHQNDLSGILIEKGWPSLAIPAIATETHTYAISENDTYTRPIGELLQPQRDTLETYKTKEREIGSRPWAAQFQQDPTPPEGNVIKATWLRRYDFSPAERKFRQIVLACDPAGKNGIRNDFTAIVICGFDENKAVYLLHVARGHWTLVQMRDRIKVLAREWNVNRVLIEDAASGMGLIQILKDEKDLNVIGQRPQGDKLDRMSRHEALFEADRILLPKDAPWSAVFETELLGFPNARHDDQVDALLLFLDWLPKARRYEVPDTIGLPYAGRSGDYTNIDSVESDFIPGFWLGQFKSKWRIAEE
jgi:predicted phage terminase large subunit-like protein